MTAISVAGLGISALDIHAKENKTLKCPAKNQSMIQLTSSQKEKENEFVSVSEPVSQSWMCCITKEEIVKAKIL